MQDFSTGQTCSESLIVKLTRASRDDEEHQHPSLREPGTVEPVPPLVLTTAPDLKTAYFTKGQASVDRCPRPNTSEPTNPVRAGVNQGSRSLGIEFDQPHGVMQTRNNGTDSPFVEDEIPTIESKFSLAMVKVRQKVRHLFANRLRTARELDLANIKERSKQTTDSRRILWFGPR
jgi:hypothetical protein